ncbi:GMC oxidoreductase-domain-containing protein [Aspergillus caelatus]|uniref:GMC oxidoreductase-domain-containing protein n=1 Tax=Aspergillus caelatus TaxID=61420 RepID=A0A5N7APA3_9EURO|nr:GMC oxidoreductase-domain-containing protein [Aspergillus caelatus]KAE8370828.1 GMC oxidoreductase-domain-containing protein [Aspergillus caelatus]
MVQIHTPKDLSSLKGCTFGFHGQPDPCLARWTKSVLGDRGIYSASGGAAAMFYKSTATTNNEIEINMFGVIGNFRGYYPGHAYNTTARHDWFTWSALKAHPRNNSGTVTLRSADPLDPPEIVFNYFDTGVGDYRADLQAMYEALELGRRALKRQPLPVSEVLPGANVTTQEDIETYIKDTAWGDHAMCTCPIGTVDDPMAVLDSKFRVRGVDRLGVVDGSAFPRIPGTFPVVSIYLVAEEAADVILSEINTNWTQ